MYLKTIRAHGFKSFADKTVIDLSNNISGIVGPNGSGKSNVVDAVRWVLGEQSIKSLRGDGAMTDVIFSGSNSRNSSGYASVTLVLDNQDRFLPLDFNEVSIKRRLYKDGTNEYYLNNEKVRLKDITNILLDSGIAKESFNIISQGKIEEILSNKPEERRIIFEEASGTLKYKRRKEEALRKLDKTHDNMNRVNDIINELEIQVEPLRVQKEKAIEYNELTEKLSNIEVALITDDITKLNFEYQNSKNKIDELNLEISKLSTDNSVHETKILEYKNKIASLENIIKEKQSSLLEVVKEVEQINSRKQIILERQKYNVDDTKLHSNMILLKEKELNLSNEINSIKINIENIKNDINELNNNLEKENKELEKIKINKNELLETLKNKLRLEQELKSKIETLKFSIDNNSTVPYAVKKVLDNPKLRGIHNIVSNLFDVEEKYSLAISTVLAASLANIVTDDEQSSKEAIYYLKNNNIGRATFFPLNVIKPRIIENEILNILNKSNGFIDVGSNLIKYDKTYTNIMLNQLGNVIVVDNIDNANNIAKKINYRYRIVTLDGQLVNVGGSLTGGNSSRKNVIIEKFELEENLRNLNKTLEDIKNIEEKINEVDNDYKIFEDRIYLINKNVLNKNMIIDNLSDALLSKNEELKVTSLEILGTNNILSNELNKEEQDVLTLYYETLDKKNKLELELNNLINKKEELNSELFEYEITVKKENSLFNDKNNLLKQLEITVNRLDVKLDNLLNSLSNDYSLTYEAAKDKYILEIDSETARNEVSNLKRKIKDIGIVNLAAIEEFDRVNERYEFLNSQRDDLLKAENTLLDIIDDLDKVMIKDFTNTFKIIKENFKTTFKELFKGGTADLKLTDPDNILTTGIEIIASPPGKKLTTISLLSGGEKTFTAISLLFAILKSKPVPFCILDEVEAALDDVNVDSFGKYVQELKDKTQFIIITHKKKTMEYADVLYGITMQESGVSKLVSVKLEEIE
ncbi:MAG: chromosome segregation protein SMC [Firmicutes bacterium]|nr:chromosome segregation protein SMC [Bacillota bacterium]